MRSQIDFQMARRNGRITQEILRADTLYELGSPQARIPYHIFQGVLAFRAERNAYEKERMEAPAEKTHPWTRV